MNERVRDTLCRMIQHYGRNVVDEPRRCEGMLNDLCPHDRREVHVLASALREGVPGAFLASQTQSSPGLLVERLTKKLEQQLGMAEPAARWAVESWGIAMGAIAPQSVADAERTAKMPPPLPRGAPAAAQGVAPSAGPPPPSVPPPPLAQHGQPPSAPSRSTGAGILVIVGVVALGFALNRCQDPPRTGPSRFGGNKVFTAPAQPRTPRTPAADIPSGPSGVFPQVTPPGPGMDTPPPQPKR